MTTSFGFLFLNIIVFAFNVIIQSHLIRFTITSHHWAEGVEIFFEVAAIIVSVQGYFMATIEPSFVLSTSFLLPLSAITWCCKLGIIASNKGIDVYAFQSNMIVNGNDMSVLLHVAVGSLALKVILLLYMMPLRINNDPEKMWGPFYLFNADFWRSCKSSRVENDDNDDDFSGDQKPYEYAAIGDSATVDNDLVMSQEEI